MASVTVGAAKKTVEAIEKGLSDHDGLKAKVESSFARLDSDKSGHLDPSEARGLIADLCGIMGLPPPTDDDYAQHLKLLDQSGDSKLDVNEVGAGVVGALLHKVGSLKHFLAIAETKKLTDADELPRA